MAALTDEDNQMVRNLIRSNLINLINDKQNDNNKKFFLTQLNEKNDDEENTKLNEFSKQIANINSETASALKEGLEMKLQRNILAKYKNDEDLVTKNLYRKRQEFEKRINVCKDKQNQLILKQEQNQQLIKQYSQFINEKETIRKRAIAKYQTELKIRLQKMLEYDILMKQLEEVRIKHEKYSKRVEKNKKFKDFLTKVIELLPDNYLEAGDSKYISLMMRHQTLYESNLDLFENLIANSDKLKALRNEYERINIEHNANKMTVNSKLGELSQIKEQLNLKNSRTEESFIKDGDKKRAKVIDLSKVFWGIDNLAEKCMDKYKYANRTVESMTITEKLDCIQDFLIKQSEIIKMVNQSTNQN